MKNILLIIVCLLLLANICIEGTNLYHPYTQRQPVVTSIKAGTSLDLSNRPIQGDVSASKIIVELGDYKCPYCLRYGKETFPMLCKKYVDGGTLRYAYADLLLPVHRNARMLATAAPCAGNQNKYWEMHDMLIEKQPATYSDVLLPQSNKDRTRSAVLASRLISLFLNRNGLTRNVAHYGLDRLIEPGVYIPYNKWRSSQMYILVHSTVDPAGIVGPIRSQLHKLDSAARLNRDRYTILRAIR